MHEIGYLMTEILKKLDMLESRINLINSYRSPIPISRNDLEFSKSWIKDFPGEAVVQIVEFVNKSHGVGIKIINETSDRLTIRTKG
jgi:hypothetical protein